MELYIPSTLALAAAEEVVRALEAGGFAPHACRLASAAALFRAESIPSHLRMVQALTREAAEAAAEAVNEWGVRGNAQQVALAEAAADAALAALNEALIWP